MSREIGRFNVIDLGVEDHGCLYLDAEVHFASGGHQGIGRVFDPSDMGALILALLDLCRKSGMGRFGFVGRVRNVHVWVTRENGVIVRLEPLFSEEGRPIDFREKEEDYFAKRTVSS